MSPDMILTNARVVTMDDEFDGTVVVRDDQIVEVSRGRSNAAGSIDLEGDYLLPGLVELHTDNMEKHFSPRPGVAWPAIPAVMAQTRFFYPKNVAENIPTTLIRRIRQEVEDG